MAPCRFRSAGAWSRCAQGWFSGPESDRRLAVALQLDLKEVHGAGQLVYSDRHEFGDSALHRSACGVVNEVGDGDSVGANRFGDGWAGVTNGQHATYAGGEAGQRDRTFVDVLVHRPEAAPCVRRRHVTAVPDLTTGQFSYRGGDPGWLCCAGYGDCHSGHLQECFLGVSCASEAALEFDGHKTAVLVAGDEVDGRFTQRPCASLMCHDGSMTSQATRLRCSPARSIPSSAHRAVSSFCSFHSFNSSPIPSSGPSEVSDHASVSADVPHGLLLAAADESLGGPRPRQDVGDEVHDCPVSKALPKGVVAVVADAQVDDVGESFGS